MVVQHNLTAMNSNRMLNITTKSQADSTEKLSSGYKINRAADDAAGLSISEKMRKQVRGLTQASSNAQDGISCVQTAEGALNEVQDMLQRMNELAVKAANGTNSTDDRTYIQNEIDQLVSEIDRVAETTKFNETYLLKGGARTGGFTAANATVAEADITGTAGSATSTTSVTLVYDGTSWIKEGDSTGTAVTLAEANHYYAAVADPQIGDRLIYDGETKKATLEDAKHKFGAAFYDSNGNRIPHNALDKYFNTDGSLIPGSVLYIDEKGTRLNSSNAVAAGIKPTFTADAPAPLELKLHVGADATSNNQIGLKIAPLTAAGIGVADLKVDGADDSNALYSIAVVKEAIQKISTQRSALGAIQNRLDHTINNLDNVVENTTAAESQIRDTDMATEMVRYSNNNILAQAGQAMLAQANQTNQGVMALLQ